MKLCTWARAIMLLDVLLYNAHSGGMCMHAAVVRSVHTSLLKAINLSRGWHLSSNNDSPTMRI